MIANIASHGIGKPIASMSRAQWQRIGLAQDNLCDAGKAWLKSSPLRMAEGCNARGYNYLSWYGDVRCPLDGEDAEAAGANVPAYGGVGTSTMASERQLRTGNVQNKMTTHKHGLRRVCLAELGTGCLDRQ